MKHYQSTNLFQKPEDEFRGDFPKTANKQRQNTGNEPTYWVQDMIAFDRNSADHPVVFKLFIDGKNRTIWLRRLMTMPDTHGNCIEKKHRFVYYEGNLKKPVKYDAEILQKIYKNTLFKA